jgi:Tol biopolymer transport system component
MPESNEAEAVVTENLSASTKKIIYFVILLACIPGILFIFLNATSFLNPFRDLAGNIYLTLVPYPTTESDSSDLYTYDIKTQKLEKIFDTDLLKYTGKKTPDGKKVAYFGKEKSDVLNIFRLTDESLKLYLYDSETNTHVSTVDTFLLANKVGGWSPDSAHLVYTGQPQLVATREEFLQPNNWSVNVLDVDNSIGLIGEGTNPIWSPDGENILYLKNDGLYVYNVATAVSQKFYDLNQYHEAKINIKFTISPNGKYLFLTSPDDNSAVLFSINSLNTLALTVVDQILTPNSYTSIPQFSPDSRYVVYHQVDYSFPDNQIAFKDPRLMVYDTRSQKQLKLLDLDHYNFDFTHIDDWRI